MIARWLLGLVRVHTATVIGETFGIATAVALIVALGAFLQSSAADMTARATAGLPIDWQAEVLPGTSPSAVAEAMRNAATLTRTATAGYTTVDGFQSATGGTVQTTGEGRVLGIETTYARDFPGNFRPLVGDTEGVLIAQQTAANLHVAPGDQVTIHRPSLPDATVRIDGVVDLPNADTMFQAVGVPPGAAPQAPPDNVLVMPAAQWHVLFDAQAAARPDTVHEQVHAMLDRKSLPTNPQAAFVAATGEGHNFEARVAGGALLANNIAVALDATREDALYARILFLFLGAPGAVVAALLTIAVARAAAGQRRRTQSLLRLRGASPRQLITLAAAEALSLGLGSIAGILAGAVAARAMLSVSVFAMDALVWILAGVLVAVAVSVTASLLPAWWDALRLPAFAARDASSRGVPRPARIVGVALLLLLLSGIIFWRTAQSGYQVVLAPEGVAAVAVDYWAFLAPTLFWGGMGLLAFAATAIALWRLGKPIADAMRRVFGKVGPFVAAAFAHQPWRLAAGVALTATAIAFATSTAIFNETYQAQARIDAELTNGAEVTVTGTPAAPAGALLTQLSSAPGVAVAVAMQHRFAYVGNDLQDLYGIDPAHIGEAATMSNAYFANGDAQAALAKLAAARDGVLVSAETVSDYQLTEGDTLNLRLQSATDRQYHTVSFRFIGVVREFPTAPRDSFLLANADYVAAATGSDAAEVVLIRTTGNPTATKQALGPLVAGLQGARVRDVTEVSQLIGSSLTAVDLAGLTRLELTFGAALAAITCALYLGLGVLDRQRSFVIMTAIGLRRRHVLAFVRSEALLMMVAGWLGGLTAGVAIAWMLVKLLSGVFDPPPEALTVPWAYLWVTLVTTVAAIVAAAWFTGARVRSAPMGILRNPP